MKNHINIPSPQPVQAEDSQPISQHLLVPPEILSLIAKFTVPIYGITATFLDGHGLWRPRVDISGPANASSLTRVCKAFQYGISEGLRSQFSGSLELVNYCNRDKWNFFSIFSSEIGLDWINERVTDLKIDGILSAFEPRIDITIFPHLRTVEVHMRGPIGWDVTDATASLTESYPSAVLYREGYLLPEIMREARQLQRSFQPPPDPELRSCWPRLETLVLLRHYVMPLDSWNANTQRQVSTHCIDICGDNFIVPMWNQSRIIKNWNSNFAEDRNYC